jgi:dTDP-glucose 4,6-dehydratase
VKKIFIIGSNSFSGSSLVNSLLNKKIYKIYGCYNSKKKDFYLPYMSNKYKKNFKDFKINFLIDSQKLNNLIFKLKPQIIIDFASICNVQESWFNPKNYFDINCRSRLNLIQASKKFNFLKKYIYISTPEIFGSSNKTIDEYEANFNPTTPYAISKLSTELTFKAYYRFFKFPVCIARFSNFYGPGQSLKRLIPKAINSIDKKVKFPLDGKGNSIRDFIFTDDFCEGINLIIKKGKVGNNYHFSSNKFYKVKDIIKMICQLKGISYKNFIEFKKDRIGKDKSYKLSCNKTIRELKWKPQYKLKKGIKMVIDYHAK